MVSEAGMPGSLASRAGWRGQPGGVALWAFRAVCAFAVLCVVYVAAQLAEARHAGVVAAALGLPLALLAAAAARTAPPSFASCAGRPRFAAPTRPALLLAAGAIPLLIMLVPVLGARLMPFDDVVNHLARLYVMVDGWADPWLSRFYAIRWQVLPNLGMELTLPWLAAATNVYVAGKLFVIVSLLLMFAGPFAIQRALYREWSLGPIAAAPFLYNGVMRYGLLNYQLGVGLMLFAVAAWIGLRRRRPALRATASLVCVIVLFFCHLVTLAMYGLAILSYELWLACAAGRLDRRRLLDLAVLVLPFVPALALLALGPGSEGAGAARGVAWGGLHARMDGLRYLLLTYASERDLIAMLAMVLGLLWAIWRRIVFMHPFGWIFLAIAAAVYLVIPNEGMGSWGAAIRVPLAVLFVLFGVLRWCLSSVALQRGFLAAIVLLSAFRAVTVEAAFRRYAAVADDLTASLPLIPRGSRVLVAADYTRREEALAAIQELPCLAIIERSSLVSIAYTHPQQQILLVKPPYREMTGGYSDQPVALPALLEPTPPEPAAPPFFDPSGRFYWADWERNYDYVYVIYRDHQPSPAPARLALLYDGHEFQLFRVIPPR
jgi:hypothetical protein